MLRMCTSKNVIRPKTFYQACMPIRLATPADAPAIAAIILPVIRAGETYALDPAMTEAAALAYWSGDDKRTFVFEDKGEILGTYYLRAN